MSFFNGGAVANEVLHTRDATHQLSEDQDDQNDQDDQEDQDNQCLHHLLQSPYTSPAQLVQPLLCCDKPSLVPAQRIIPLKIIGNFYAFFSAQRFSDSGSQQ